MAKFKKLLKPAVWYNFFAIPVLLGALLKFTTDWSKLTITVLFIGFVGEMMTFFIAGLQEARGKQIDDSVSSMAVSTSAAGDQLLDQNTKQAINKRLNALTQKITELETEIGMAKDAFSDMKVKTEKYIGVFK